MRVNGSYSLIAFFSCVVFIAVAAVWLLPPKFLIVNPRFGGYYDKLARSFLAGELSVGTPPAALLYANNPYAFSVHAKFSSNPRLDIWDHSLYQGRLYLYFGVAPALLLYTPYRALTGVGLKDGVALLFLLSLAFGGFVALLLRLRPISFPAQPWWILGVSLIVLVTSAAWPILLSRARTYEIPVAAALAAMMWGIWWIVTAYDRGSWATWRLALGSLCFGLAIASRPHYVFAIVAEYICVMIFAWNTTDRRWRIFFALTLPILLISIALGLYNYLRFENIFEFGARYPLTVADQRGVTFFSASRILSGLYILLIHPLQENFQFPYFSPNLPVPTWAMKDRIFIEHPFGYLFIAPWLLLAAACLIKNILAKDPGVRAPNHFIWASWLLAIAGLCNVLADASWAAVIDRYAADFAFFFTALGLLILLRTAQRSGPVMPQVIYGILICFAVYGCLTADLYHAFIQKH
jgi:hypothetical protein